MLTANVYESKHIACAICGRFGAPIGWVGAEDRHACLACIDSALEATVVDVDSRVRELETRISRASRCLSGLPVE